MPAGGYIASINNEGIPLTTGSAQFNDDYYWNNTANNTYGFLRSGRWDNGSHAGRFALNVNTVPACSNYKARVSVSPSLVSFVFGL